MSVFFEAIVEFVALYFGERINQPVIKKPPILPEKYPREQTVLISSINDSGYKHRARRRHIKHHVKLTGPNA